MNGRAVDWSDVRAIARELAERHGDVAPLTVRFTDLHRFVLAIPGFRGDPKSSNEKILEAIQMAWLDEVED
jgi:FeS assembly protein IscX